MITAKTSDLSLKEGLKHLSQLLSKEPGQGLSDLTPTWLDMPRLPTSLELLLPGSELYEAWKYTPLSPFKRPWQKATGQLVQANELTESLPSLAPEALARTPALKTVPLPRSPWDVLIPQAATAVNHFRLAQSGHYSLSFLFSEPLGAASAFYTFFVPPQIEAHIWLSTAIHTESLGLLRLHFHLAPGSRLYVYYTNPPTAQGALLAITSAHVEEAAQFSSLQALRTYEWLRFEALVCLAGRHAEAHLSGLADPSHNQVSDTAIRVEHVAPHTHSNQLFRSIAYKGGRRVFLGRIYVDRLAQKTNAYQSHKAILWEPGAEVYTRPQLEIFADDVRCTHGATTGFLQGDMLFYLQARGIPQEIARPLIARGFLSEALSSLLAESLQDKLMSRFFPI